MKAWKLWSLWVLWGLSMACGGEILIGGQSEEPTSNLKSECKQTADGTLCCAAGQTVCGTKCCDSATQVCNESANTCTCAPETKTAFCARMRNEGKCGLLVENDNCGEQREFDCITDACMADMYCDGAVNRCISDKELPSNNQCPGQTLLLGVPVYGDTSKASANYGNSLSSSSNCRNAAGNNNALGNELVYSYAPTTNGTFRVRVTPFENHNPMLWITMDECGGNGGGGGFFSRDTTCMGVANSRGNGGVEELSVAGRTRTTYYFYVDAANRNSAGAFIIEIQ